MKRQYRQFTAPQPTKDAEIKPAKCANVLERGGALQPSQQSSAFGGDTSRGFSEIARGWGSPLLYPKKFQGASGDRDCPKDASDSRGLQSNNIEERSASRRIVRRTHWSAFAELKSSGSKDARAQSTRLGHVFPKPQCNGFRLRSSFRPSTCRRGAWERLSMRCFRVA